MLLVVGVTGLRPLGLGIDLTAEIHREEDLEVFA